MKKEAIEELWKRGIIKWKLHSSQKEVYDQMKKVMALDGSKKFVFNCSRRWGKSFLLCLVAAEYGFSKPNSQIKYACPTQIMARRIVLPLFNEIFSDCPENLRPSFDKKEGTYTFKNGSMIQISGVDQGNAERLRGTASDFIVCDEVGFADNIEYVINDILLPQMLTRENTFMLLASTPPKSPSHPFVKFVLEAQNGDYYAHRTIYQNPMVNEKKIIQFMKEAGGEKSTTWRREYLAEIVTDEDAAIIPEFNAEKEAEIVVENVRPDFFDYYAAMDLGVIDLTFLIYGYWDFKRAVLVVEHEKVMNKKFTTTDLSDCAKRIELDYYGGKKPYLRVADADLLILNDLDKLHNILFVKTKKDDKEAAINELRIMISQNKIEINPRCKNLISHLKYGIWKTGNKTFDRSGDYGHFDGIDALIYLLRNVNRYQNPYPKEIDLYQIYNKVNTNSKKDENVWSKIFNNNKIK